MIVCHQKHFSLNKVSKQVSNMPPNAVDCLQEAQRLRENEHKFSENNLSEFELSILSKHSYSEEMTDYEFFKSDNQMTIHGLGRKLLGGVSWERAKEEFIKLDDNNFVIEIQKAVCHNKCFFDPLKCMDDEHDGKLRSLLKKLFMRVYKILMHTSQG